MIHATMVVLTARTMSPATTTAVNAAAAIKGKTEAASLSPEEKKIVVVDNEIKRKNKQVVVVVVVLKRFCSEIFMFSSVCLYILFLGVVECLGEWPINGCLGGRKRIEGGKKVLIAVSLIINSS